MAAASEWICRCLSGSGRSPARFLDLLGDAHQPATEENRAAQREVDRHWYRERNVCERFWGKVKQYRRVATRYEKKAANFLAFVKVAAMMVMLK